VLDGGARPRVTAVERERIDFVHHRLGAVVFVEVEAGLVFEVVVLAAVRVGGNLDHSRADVEALDDLGDLLFHGHESVRADGARRVEHEGNVDRLVDAHGGHVVSGGTRGCWAAVHSTCGTGRLHHHDRARLRGSIVAGAVLAVVYDLVRAYLREVDHVARNFDVLRDDAVHLVVAHRSVVDVVARVSRLERHTVRTQDLDDGLGVVNVLDLAADGVSQARAHVALVAVGARVLDGVRGSTELGEVAQVALLALAVCGLALDELASAVTAVVQGSNERWGHVAGVGARGTVPLGLIIAAVASLDILDPINPAGTDAKFVPVDEAGCVLRAGAVKAVAVRNGVVRVGLAAHAFEAVIYAVRLEACRVHDAAVTLERHDRDSGILDAYVARLLLRLVRRARGLATRVI